MTTEMNSKNTKKLTIPDEIMKQTKLGEAEALRVFGNDGCLILLHKNPTAWEICMASELMIHICGMLGWRLINAVKKQEAKCRTVKIPDELLEMSGIPKGAPLDICAGEGEIYISTLDEEDDPMEALPDFIRDYIAEYKLDINALRHLLESEDQIHE